MAVCGGSLVVVVCGGSVVAAVHDGSVIVTFLAITSWWQFVAVAS